MARPSVTNLLRSLDIKPEGEVFEPLVTTDQCLFERIISYGHTTPPGMWFDQPRDEWVVLLSGAARLRFDGCDEVVEMEPGDAMKIPAHTRHRVEWTTPERQSVWLALHFPHHEDTAQPN